MTPKVVILQSCKKLQVFDNFFFEKNPSSLFVQIGRTKPCAEIFFRVNGSGDI